MVNCIDGHVCVYFLRSVLFEFCHLVVSRDTLNHLESLLCYLIYFKLKNSGSCIILILLFWALPELTCRELSVIFSLETGCGLPHPILLKEKKVWEVLRGLYSCKCLQLCKQISWHYKNNCIPIIIIPVYINFCYFRDPRHNCRGYMVCKFECAKKKWFGKICDSVYLMWPYVSCTLQH